MADRRLEERLQPSLLDRLTDDNPGDQTETRDDRAIDAKRLRDILRRDLSWLLNTTNLEAELGSEHSAEAARLEANAGSQVTFLDPDEFPQAARSVLNFGVRAVSGSFATERRAAEIRTAIADAISEFEPRVSAGTLDVVLRSEGNARETVITFDIRADMWAQPVPLDLYLRSEVDLTTGNLTLESRG